MRTSEIRARFLKYFERQGHTVLPSASLVPVGDPTVLLTVAGMQQFKAFFSGERSSPYPRIATVQKCARTIDFDVVGDLSHLTLFEMLGNFSFGDYFKEEAIRFAYDFTVNECGIDPDLIWITAYEGAAGVPRDEESPRLWADLDHPPERVAFAGEDNFWGPTGASGPCGPTTEIFVNLQPDEPDVGPIRAPDRYLEIWNLVFNQYLKTTQGNLEPLARHGVDTGAGLERWAMVLQGVPSIYDTDIWAPPIAAAARRAGVTYESASESGRSIRITAQHTRAAVFLIGDGVMPGNEGRGYVVRRSLRQAVRYARLLGVDDDALTSTASASIDAMSDQYPELEQRRDFILTVVRDEEARFRRTLDSGMRVLGEMLGGLPRGGTLDGARAFVLYDTYGFPLDITREEVAARGMAVDEPTFETALAEQRARSRAAQASQGALELPTGFGETAFQGYDFTTAVQGAVVALGVKGELVEAAQAPAEALIVLDRTPFYSEAGGQVGDAGTLKGQRGAAEVVDTIRAPEGTSIHRARMVHGAIAVGDVVQAEVLRSRRFDIMRNHSATHLLHAALRHKLGRHVTQAGSLVAPDRLRFDFTHTSPVARADLRDIETWINDRILENLTVETELTEVREAVERGAMALFGEKYGEAVRMVSMGQVSRELCGGTHCGATGQIGLFAIASESGIAAGVRRIEAVTGRGAVAHVHQQADLLTDAAGELETAPTEMLARLRRLKQQAQELRRRVASAERAEARRVAEDLIDAREAVNGMHLVAGRAPGVDRDALRELTTTIRRRLDEPWVIVLASVVNGKPSFVAAASQAAIAAGVHSGDLVKAVAAAAGGGGGGRPELAMAGGADAAKISEALDAGRGYLRAIGVAA